MSLLYLSTFVYFDSNEILQNLVFLEMMINHVFCSVAQSLDPFLDLASMLYIGTTEELVLWF